MFKKLIILSSLTLILTAGCGGGGEDTPPQNGASNSLNLALSQAAENSIIPAVNAFKLQAESFNTAATNFCAAPETNTLETLQGQWKALNEQWFVLLNYKIETSPLSDNIVFPKYTFIDSMRLRGTNYLETARSGVIDDMGGDHALDTAYFGGKTFQHVGLLVLEVAIFETATGERSQVTNDIVSEYTNAPRKCEIVQGLAAQISQHADDVQDGWNASFKAEFLSEELSDGTVPLTALIVSVQEYLDYLQKRNIVVINATLAQHSWQSISRGIDEIETLLEGTDATTVSFFGLMTSSGFTTPVATVRDNIIAIRAAITAQDATMLEISLGKLDGNFKREIPTGLEITLGINFTDGD